MSSKPTIYVVGGATASGKTSSAIALARVLNTEIINVDSRQVYTELNIGVAKPSLSDLNAVVHHGIGHVGIEYHYNAGTHADSFRPVASELLHQNGSVVLCGGTGLYVEALLYGMDDLPQHDPDLRSEILDQYVENGIDPLIKMLLQLDPDAGLFVQLNNPQRVMRALELSIQLRKPLSHIYGQDKKQYFEGVEIKHLGIQLNREVLYQRINQRVDQMVEDGIIEEARNLYPKRDLKALQTVGYSELFAHFDGTYELTEALDKIKQHTRNYAKRQITYFNNRFVTDWIAAAEWDQYIRKFVKIS